MLHKSPSPSQGLYICGRCLGELDGQEQTEQAARASAASAAAAAAAAAATRRATEAKIQWDKDVAFLTGSNPVQRLDYFQTRAGDDSVRAELRTSVRELDALPPDFIETEQEMECLAREVQSGVEELNQLSAAVSEAKTKAESLHHAILDPWNARFGASAGGPSEGAIARALFHVALVVAVSFLARLLIPFDGDFGELILLHLFTLGFCGLWMCGFAFMFIKSASEAVNKDESRLFYLAAILFVIVGAVFWLGISWYPNFDVDDGWDNNFLLVFLGLFVLLATFPIFTMAHMKAGRILAHRWRDSTARAEGEFPGQVSLYDEKTKALRALVSDLNKQQQLARDLVTQGGQQIASGTKLTDAIQTAVSRAFTDWAAQFPPSCVSSEADLKSASKEAAKSLESQLSERMKVFPEEFSDATKSLLNALGEFVDFLEGAKVMLDSEDKVFSLPAPEQRYENLKFKQMFRHLFIFDLKNMNGPKSPAHRSGGAKSNVSSTPGGKWYYAIGKEKQGPFSMEEIKGLIVSGEIVDDTQLIAAGWKKWFKMKQIKQFSATKSAEGSMVKAAAESDFDIEAKDSGEPEVSIEDKTE